MSIPTITPAVRALLKKIHAGESHRCSQDTYTIATERGLAYYEQGTGWHLTEDGRAEITPFTPLEIAYRIPGKPWARRIIKTRAAFNKLIEKLNEQGAETRFRDVEQGQ